MRYPIRLVLLVCLLAAAAAPASAQWTPMNPVVSVRPQADGEVFALKAGFLKVQVCSDSIVRVRYAMADAFPAGGPDPVVVKASWPEVRWTHAETTANVTISTARLTLTIDRRDASISYAAAEGRRLVQEASRKLMPVTVNTAFFVTLPA